MRTAGGIGVVHGGVRLQLMGMWTYSESHRVTCKAPAAQRHQARSAGGVSRASWRQPPKLLSRREGSSSRPGRWSGCHSSGCPARGGLPGALPDQLLLGLARPLPPLPQSEKPRPLQEGPVSVADACRGFTPCSVRQEARTQHQHRRRASTSCTAAMQPHCKARRQCELVQPASRQRAAADSSQRTVPCRCHADPPPAWNAVLQPLLSRLPLGMWCARRLQHVNRSASPFIRPPAGRGCEAWDGRVREAHWRRARPSGRRWDPQGRSRIRLAGACKRCCDQSHTRAGIPGPCRGPT